MDNLIHNPREWSLLGEILSGLFLRGDDNNCFRVSAKYGLLLLILLASPPPAAPPLIRVYRSSSDIEDAWVRRVAVIAISSPRGIGIYRTITAGAASSS